MNFIRKTEPQARENLAINGAFEADWKDPPLWDTEAGIKHCQILISYF